MSVYGSIFRVSTFGESHGIGVGCIVDGVPPGLKLTEEDVQPQLTRRRPGQSSLTTQRQEGDVVSILSGTENGVTLGTPVAMIVRNQDQRKFDYANTSSIPRPGHADYTYQVKYGIKASSGGGRASARETIGRVAAGGIAEKWLREQYGTSIVTWVSAVGHVRLPEDVAKRLETTPPTRDEIDSSGALLQLEDGRFVDVYGNVYEGSSGEPTGEKQGRQMPEDCAKVKETKIHTRCPHAPSAAIMAARIQQLRAAGDSTGGILTTVVRGCPVGLGEPCFDKVEAELAKAMMSLPATKGFEVGTGFEGVKMTGSQHNDLFAGKDADSSLLYTRTNNAGGTLGGITSGQDIVFRVAIKPVSSISLEQETASFDGVVEKLVVKGRHDPCVLSRASPLVESMTAIVLCDLAMRQRARVGPTPLQSLQSNSHR